MKLLNYLLPCRKHLALRKKNPLRPYEIFLCILWQNNCIGIFSLSSIFNSGSSGLGDYRMNIGRMIILTLIWGLLGQLYAYAEQPLKLEAKDGKCHDWFRTRTSRNLAHPLSHPRACWSGHDDYNRSKELKLKFDRKVWLLICLSFVMMCPPP